MLDPYSIGTEPGTMKASGIPRRILGAETMEENLKTAIEQKPSRTGSRIRSAPITNQKVPTELKDLQITDYRTNPQRSYKGFENICPIAEQGCILARDPEKFWRLCVTEDHEYCSHLDKIMAGVAMKNPIALLLGGFE